MDWETASLEAERRIGPFQWSRMDNRARHEAIARVQGGQTPRLGPAAAMGRALAEGVAQAPAAAFGARGLGFFRQDRLGEPNTFAGDQAQVSQLRALLPQLEADPARRAAAAAVRERLAHLEAQVSSGPYADRYAPPDVLRGATAGDISRAARAATGIGGRPHVMEGATAPVADWRSARADWEGNTELHAIASELTDAPPGSPEYQAAYASVRAAYDQAVGEQDAYGALRDQMAEYRYLTDNGANPDETNPEAPQMSFARALGIGQQLAGRVFGVNPQYLAAVNDAETRDANPNPTLSDGPAGTARRLGSTATGPYQIVNTTRPMLERLLNARGLEIPEGLRVTPEEQKYLQSAVPHYLRTGDPGALDEISAIIDGSWIRDPEYASYGAAAIADQSRGAPLMQGANQGHRAYTVHHDGAGLAARTAGPNAEARGALFAGDVRGQNYWYRAPRSTHAQVHEHINKLAGDTRWPATVFEGEPFDPNESPADIARRRLLQVR